MAHIHVATLVAEARVASDHEQPSQPREAGEDIFNDPISKVLLLWITTQVVKWKYGNGWLVGQFQRFTIRYFTRFGIRIYYNFINPQRLLYILTKLFSFIFIFIWKLVFHLIISSPRNTNTATFAYAF